MHVIFLNSSNIFDLEYYKRVDNVIRRKSDILSSSLRYTMAQKRDAFLSRREII